MDSGFLPELPPLLYSRGVTTLDTNFNTKLITQSNDWISPWTSWSFNILWAAAVHQRHHFIMNSTCCYISMRTQKIPAVVVGFSPDTQQAELLDLRVYKPSYGRGLGEFWLSACTCCLLLFATRGSELFQRCKNWISKKINWSRNYLIW